MAKTPSPAIQAGVEGVLRGAPLGAAAARDFMDRDFQREMSDKSSQERTKVRLEEDILQRARMDKEYANRLQNYYKQRDFERKDQEKDTALANYEMMAEKNPKTQFARDWRQGKASGILDGDDLLDLGIQSYEANKAQFDAEAQMSEIDKKIRDGMKEIPDGYGGKIRVYLKQNGDLGFDHNRNVGAGGAGAGAPYDPFTEISPKGMADYFDKATKEYNDLIKNYEPDAIPLALRDSGRWIQERTVLLAKAARGATNVFNAGIADQKQTQQTIRGMESLMKILPQLGQMGLQATGKQMPSLDGGEGGAPGPAPGQPMPSPLMPAASGPTPGVGAANAYSAATGRPAQAQEAQPTPLNAPSFDPQMIASEAKILKAKGMDKEEIRKELMRRHPGLVLR